MMTPNEGKLQSAFREALGLPDGTDVAKLTYRAVAEWDSVAHMQLVATIEAAFDIMLETDDVLGMSSYERARDIVVKHGVVI